MLTNDKNGSLYLVYCRPYCFLGAEWIRIILDFSFSQILAMVENDKSNLTHFKLALQRTAFSFPYFFPIASTNFWSCEEKGAYLILYYDMFQRQLCSLHYVCPYTHTDKHLRQKSRPTSRVDWLEIWFVFKSLFYQWYCIFCTCAQDFSVQDVQRQFFHAMQRKSHL